MRAAIITGTTVSNVVELDKLSDVAGAVACPTCNIGDNWDGTTFTPAAPPSLTLTQQFKIFQNEIQGWLDSTAQKRQYDSALSCTSYAGSSVTGFAADAAAMKTWRDAVWAYAITNETAVTNNPSSMPTLAAFMAAIAIACPPPW
jgi:hypothetical protein